MLLDEERDTFDAVNRPVSQASNASKSKNTRDKSKPKVGAERRSVNQ